MSSAGRGREHGVCSPSITSPGRAPHARELFAHNVRSRRIARGLSQEALAFDCDMDRTYISSIERAEINVSVDSMERIAAALHTELPELLRPKET